MQCCRTCKYIEVEEYGTLSYSCTYQVVLPEIMKSTFLEDIIDDPDQYGGDCDCYELDKSNLSLGEARQLALRTTTIVEEGLREDRAQEARIANLVLDDDDDDRY